MTLSAKPNIIVITGPTASGKTKLSLLMCRILNGEIISADSRQVYKYMDIGTAKPTLEERVLVPHHCIDICLPDEYFSAGEYQYIARNAVQKIINKGKIPVVVGGSGLYISALIDGIFSGNYRDERLRKKLKNQADKNGVDLLYQQLKICDPDSAERIHPNDEKRIIRALEVYQLSGVTMSELKAKSTKRGEFSPLIFGLKWDRKEIYHRINLRVENMIKSGLVKEVGKLISMGYTRELNSMDSVGYKEVFQYLNGEISIPDMKDLIQRNTRHYAKRQLTWFRKDSRIRWLDISIDTAFETIAENIVKYFNLSIPKTD